MTDKILAELRAVSVNLKNAILRNITVVTAEKTVTVYLVTDAAFTPSDKERAAAVLRGYVPAYFGLNLEISKLAPDGEMVKRKITEAIAAFSKAVSATLGDGDITVTKTLNGFDYVISVAPSLAPADLCDRINAYLKKQFCGEFYGKINTDAKSLDDLEIEETPDEPEFETPARTFDIEEFSFIEGEKIQKKAVYLSDINLVRDEVVLCGTIEDVRERTYTNKSGVEKAYFIFTLNDGTAALNVTYFTRLKSLEKIKKLQVGDSIVCTGLNEEFRGNLRYTAKFIDYGKTPAGFVPEKRASKPVPKYYKTVKPMPFVDMEQADLFSDKRIPECLKGKTFVVFDLETTGLNSSPVTGNMDKIIEIGAYKVVDGQIAEVFSTFINPEKKLSDEIINLTGITEEMVAPAPTYAQVMPDFFKFCYGSVLVGHNAAGFDYKFVDYYWSSLGYIFERKIIDTLPLSQELLFLSNYKLNTVAEKFNISFNHHRATDDALATAKIFIELIRLKKSLPKIQ